MRPAVFQVPVRALAFLVLAWLLCGQAGAQADGSSTVQRTYPGSLEVVQKGLQQIGGFGGGKLPMLDGFVTATSGQLEHYERPYYQYRVHVKPVDANSTAVSVEAKISAWYADSNPARSEYRSLLSNGRLEADLLDRLQEALRGAIGTSAPSSSPAVSASHNPGLSPDPSAKNPVVRPSPRSSDAVVKAAAPTSSQQELDAILAERQAVREKTTALQAQIDQLKAADHKPANASKLASVKHSGVGVMSRQNFGGPVLFRAQAEDEFEVVELQPGWAQVRLGPDSTGYIQADELALPDGMVEKSAGASPDVAQPAAGVAPRDLGFSVSREDVTVFSGDWVRLKGKKVLFVYAQPRGLLSDMASQDAKLGYAKRIFESRYRTVSQSNTDVEGVVVVFLGSRGGVAAATLPDIRQWVEGGLADEAFVNRCSLDPPAEFRSLRLN
ncbi:MAG: hypothetical protein WA628_07645 [Terriglobales bacterium]